MPFISHKLQGIFYSYIGNLDSIFKNAFLQTLLEPRIRTRVSPHQQLQLRQQWLR